MTGCPNGCARPYISEIGLVGKAPGIYNLYPCFTFVFYKYILTWHRYIGAGFAGERLSKLYKEAANEKEILEALKPILRRFASEKNPKEHFGDFVVRAGIVKATLAGNQFHDI